MILWKAGVSNHFLLWVSRYLLTVWYIKSGAYVMRGKRGATNIGSNLCFGCNVWFDRPYNVNSTSSPFRNASENWQTCQIPIRKSSIEASDHGFPRTRQLIVLILTLTTRAISQNNERGPWGVILPGKQGEGYSNTIDNIASISSFTYICLRNQ